MGRVCDYFGVDMNGIGLVDKVGLVDFVWKIKTSEILGDRPVWMDKFPSDCRYDYFVALKTTVLHDLYDVRKLLRNDSPDEVLLAIWVTGLCGWTGFRVSAVTTISRL